MFVARFYVGGVSRLNHGLTRISQISRILGFLYIHGLSIALGFNSVSTQPTRYILNESPCIKNLNTDKLTILIQFSRDIGNQFNTVALGFIRNHEMQYIFFLKVGHLWLIHQF